MKERPILMSAPMVRACLRSVDPKTQTRRIVKPQPAPFESWDWSWPVPRGTPGTRICWRDDGRPNLFPYCPYGVPGDVLWVREAHAVKRHEPCLDHERDYQELARPVIRYLADGAEQRFEGDRSTDTGIFRGVVEKGRPSIHMPRWASRITLRITDVRVERLQEISEADAAAEGVEPPVTEREDHDWTICPACGGTGLHGALGERLGYMEVDCTDCDTHAKRFRHLWTAINGPGSWDANPWVWIVTFERTTP